jgi:hypothetical protein
MKKMLWVAGLSVFGLLLGGLGMVAFFNHRLEGVVVREQQGQSLEATFARLEADFPFKAPPSGQPLAIDETRLNRYLAVRRDVSGHRERFEKARALLEAPTVPVEEGVEAASALAASLSEVRTAFLAALQKANMSPSEFSALTRAAYRDFLEVLQKRERDEEDAEAQGEEWRAQTQVPGLSEEEQRALSSQLALLRKRQAQRDAEVDKGFAPLPNEALLAAHRAELEALASPDFDQVLEDFGKSLRAP